MRVAGVAEERDAAKVAGVIRGLVVELVDVVRAPRALRPSASGASERAPRALRPARSTARSSPRRSTAKVVAAAEHGEAAAEHGEAAAEHGEVVAGGGASSISKLLGDVDDKNVRRALREG